MKGTHPTRLLSLLLALIFCIYLVPTEALAIEAKKSILETERTYARDYDSVESPDIVSEIASSRDEYQKEYLLSNGQHKRITSGTASQNDESRILRQLRCGFRYGGEYSSIFNYYHRLTRANTPASASFRRFLSFSPWRALARLRLKSQKSLEYPSLADADSFAGAEMRPDKERPAENTAVLSRDLTPYGRISARQNRVCPCQPMVMFLLCYPQVFCLLADTSMVPDSKLNSSVLLLQELHTGTMYSLVSELLGL